VTAQRKCQNPILPIIPVSSKAKTDAGEIPATIDELDGRPEIANLVGIFSALAEQSDAQVLTQYAGQGFGGFKSDLAELAVEKLGPITSLMARYLSDPDELDRILAKSGHEAAAIADPIVADVRRIIGFSGA